MGATDERAPGTAVAGEVAAAAACLDGGRGRGRGGGRARFRSGWYRAPVPTAYVTNYYGNAVTPINLLTNKPGTPIKVGVWPEGIAVTPDGATVYVVNNLSNTVTPIHTATNKPGTPIKVGAGPEDIAIR